MQRIAIWNQARTILFSASVEVADTSLSRVWGLLGRAGLDAGGGLWIRPSSGVHTFGMRFAIDVVGLDKEHRIVRLWQCLRPWRITSVSTAVRSVLELPAGFVSQAGLQIGQKLHLESAEEKAT
ncbi:DUF192 domain-containing protein [Terriglobus roseus]|uniref:DUF192 domain-containing protein n=1 Tax=Terriglobus roseus TaxID=392734 RepID=A0A1H4Q3I2_9BACT|nr:hypothetical protein SAMN05443244_2756 [Terriglobus roseus]